MSVDVDSVVYHIAGYVSKSLALDATVEAVGSHEYVIRLTDSSGVLIPRLEQGEPAYEVEVKVDPQRMKLQFKILLKVGGKTIGKYLTDSDYDVCDNMHVSQLIVKRVEHSIAGLFAIREFASKLRDAGLVVTGFECDDICESFSIRSTYGDVTATLYGCGYAKTAEILVMKTSVSEVGRYFYRKKLLEELARQCEARGLGDLADKFARYVPIIALDPYVNGYVHLSIKFVPPSLVKTLVEIFNEAVRREEERVHELYATLDPVDAVVLNIFINNVSGFSDVMNSRLGALSHFLTKDRAKEYLAQIGIQPENADELLSGANILHVLYEEGRLRIDEDGYLVLDGRRMVDVVKKYTTGEDAVTVYNGRILRVSDGEKTLLEKLLTVATVDLERACSGTVPERVLSVIASSDSLMQKYSHVLAGSRRVWSSLPREIRVKLLASSPSLIDLAKSNGWSWVFEDPYLVAEALTASKTPGEATKALLDHFPEFFGDGYSVVYAGNEPFVKVGSVILQVRWVRKGFVSVHGTVGTSRVGIVARGRTVAEAARTIAENLIDTVAELREVAKNVVVEEGYKTPLFTVPVIVVGAKKIPLQPGLEDILAKWHATRESKDETVVT